MFFKPVLLFLFCCLASGLGAQVVWPGDVNRNGEVTVVDLLYWGIASGERGSARPDGSADWSAQPIGEAWDFDFADGTNFLYADADGSGRVNRLDVEDALLPNFGLTHGLRSPDGFPTQPDTSSLRLALTPTVSVAAEGMAFDIDLALEGAMEGTEGFSGMAVYLSYSADLLGELPRFSLDTGGWIPGSNGDNDGNPNNDRNVADEDGNYGGNGAVQYLFRKGDADGNAGQLGITLNNRAPVDIEATTLGSFRIIIEDIVLGLEIDTFRMTVDSLLLTGDDITPLVVARGNAEVIVARDTSGLTATQDNLLPDASELTVYPNPTSQKLFFTLPGRPLGVFLTDPLGRRHKQSFSVYADGRYGIALPAHLPAGIYYLCVNYPGRVASSRFLLAR